MKNKCGGISYSEFVKPAERGIYVPTIKALRSLGLSRVLASIIRDAVANGMDYRVSTPDLRMTDFNTFEIDSSKNNGVKTTEITLKISCVRKLINVKKSRSTSDSKSKRSGSNESRKSKALRRIT